MTFKICIVIIFFIHKTIKSIFKVISIVFKRVKWISLFYFKNKTEVVYEYLQIVRQTGGTEQF